MQTQRYLTADQAATHLRVEVHTVYRLAKAGQIPAVRIGGQWRFHSRALLAWYRTQLSPPHTTPR